MLQCLRYAGAARHRSSFRDCLGLIDRDDTTDEHAYLNVLDVDGRLGYRLDM